MLEKDSKEKVEIWVLNWIERGTVIQAIKTLREDWQQAVESESLYGFAGDVGLILDDLARFFDLTPEECTQALGHELE